FFQAEDGIRDRNVTGVQTCALPICRHGGGRGRSTGHDHGQPQSPRRAQRRPGALSAERGLSGRSRRSSASLRRALGSRGPPQCAPFRRRPERGAGETGPKGTRLEDAPAAAPAGRPLPVSPDRAAREQDGTHAAFASRLADNGAGMKAREQRTAAAALLHEAGAERLAEQLLAGRTEAAEIEALPDLPRLGELSDEERKVAELVRMGLKNREIAERIFVSLRTVELRLTAVYRKLDVGSRTELVSRLAGNPRLAAV